MSGTERLERDQEMTAGQNQAYISVELYVVEMTLLMLMLQLLYVYVLSGMVCQLSALAQVLLVHLLNIALVVVLHHAVRKKQHQL